MGIAHSVVSALANDASKEVSKNAWNADHLGHDLALHIADISTPSTITISHAGAAIPVTSQVCAVTTDGDSDLDNGTLANGTVGQQIDIICVVQGNAADSYKVTPTTAIGFTALTFTAPPIGKGCRLVYTSAGWACVGLFGTDTVTINAGSIITDTTTGLKIGTATTQKLGFFNSTPIVKGTAFTQTHSTASHTHAAVTSLAAPAGGTGATAGAYDTAANRNLMITSHNAMRTDIENVKQTLNGLIDDLQALGLIA